MRNLLSSFTRHRHIIHSGYTFSGNGSWILQVCIRINSSPSIFLLYVPISITQLDCFVFLLCATFRPTEMQNRMPRFRYWTLPKHYKTTKCSVWCVHIRTLYRWKFTAPQRIGINCRTNRLRNCAKFVSIRWTFLIRAAKNSTHLSVSIFLHLNLNFTFQLESCEILFWSFSIADYLSPMLVPARLSELMDSSDVVGNIRFSHPTLYVFPGGQGDAALFGINGFNMLGMPFILIVWLKRIRQGYYYYGNLTVRPIAVYLNP